MTNLLLTTETDAPVLLRLLSVESLDAAVNLCDACVGKNLYTRDELKQVIEDANRFFYLVETQEGEIIGYFYFYLTSPQSIAASSRLDVKTIAEVCPGLKAGEIKSVGLKKEYRGLGIAESMIRFAQDRLQEMGAETIFAVCWKIRDYVPLGSALVKNDFQFLSEARKVWFDNEALVCPICNGRCVCDAAVYYRKRTKGMAE